MPALARLMASSITARMPRSSMSRMVKAPMPEAFTFARSSTSTSRMPTSAAREPSTIGEKPARFTSEGAPRPSTAASGIPWMFPVGLVSAGVRVGVGVEPDEAELLLPPVEVPREPGDRPHRHGVVAAEHHGGRPRLERLRHAVAQRLADLEDLLQVLEARVPGPLGLPDLDAQVAPVVHLVAELDDLRVHLRHAEGGGAHVDAAAAGAEVERNADEGHASLRHGLRFRKGDVATP